MPQRRVNVTRGQAKRIRQLERQLDDYTLRTLLSGTNQRLMRPERLENLKAGRGKLQPWESERLTQIQKNSDSLARLKELREDELTTKPKKGLQNRSLRTWLVKGKRGDVPYDMQPRKTQRKQHSAIRALYFLGAEPDASVAYTYVAE